MIRQERNRNGFVLGILLNLNDSFYIKSNRESGYGRYDIMLIPRNSRSRGIIFEFKKANPVYDESLEKALKVAIKQIEEKKYETQLLEAGVREKEIIKIAVAFEGKEILMKYFLGGE